MSEINITFTYIGNKIILQCKGEDKIENVIKKLSMKIEIDIDKIYLLYNGGKINLEMKVEDIINNQDKNNKQMNIIIYDYNSKIKKENIKKSEQIICPVKIIY